MKSIPILDDILESPLATDLSVKGLFDFVVTTQDGSNSRRNFQLRIAHIVSVVIQLCTNRNSRDSEVRFRSWLFYCC